MTRPPLPATHDERAARATAIGLRCFPQSTIPPVPPYAVSGLGEMAGLSAELVILSPGDDIHPSHRNRVWAIFELTGGKKGIILSRGLPAWRVKAIERANEKLVELGFNPMSLSEIEEEAMARFTVD